MNDGLVAVFPHVYNMFLRARRQLLGPAFIMGAINIPQEGFTGPHVSFSRWELGIDCT